MATTTLYCGSADAFIASADDGSSGGVNPSGGDRVGRYSSTARRVYLAAWDVTPIGSDVVTDVVLSVTVWSAATTATVLEARARDWGGTVELADWVPVASLGSLPLLATLVASGSTGRRDMTSEAAFITAAAGWATGTVHICFSTDRHRLNSPTYVDGTESPGISSYSGSTSTDPRLVVTHDPASDPIDIDIAATFPLMTCAASITAVAEVDVAASLPLMTCSAQITAAADLVIAATLPLTVASISLTTPGSGLTGPATLVATATRTTLTLTPA